LSTRSARGCAGALRQGRPREGRAGRPGGRERRVSPDGTVDGRLRGVNTGAGRIVRVNYAFIIDNRRCIGCHACSVACKTEHEVPVGVARTWVKYVEKGVFPDTRRTFQVTR